MSSPPRILEPSFLAIQRARLVALRNDLMRTIHRDEEEAKQVQTAAQGQASEAEDHAQDLTITENDRALSSRLRKQRIAVERALVKINEGTYGISDASGQLIPIARLQAYPQAVLTTTEENDHRG